MNKRITLIVAAILLGILPVAAQNVSVSTNLVDVANMGTLNVSASYAVARHWSVVADVKYNPFDWKGGDAFAKQRLVAAGARFWPWHIFSGWWMSGKGQWQEYNSGGLVSPKTTEGDRFGASFSAGYAWMLGKHFNLDIGAGIWGGADRYVSYSCPRCGSITGSGTRVFILPNDITLALTYIF